MKRLVFILLLLFAGICCSCKNDDDNSCIGVDCLPPETQTGENTFGFLVNGESFNIRNTSKQTAIYQGGFIQFGAGGIYMVVSDPLEIGVDYQLSYQGVESPRARYYVNTDPNLGCQYDFSDTYQGNLVFTNIDTQNFVISGTFEFSAIKDGCENVDVTEGRFDLQYIP